MQWYGCGVGGVVNDVEMMTLISRNAGLRSMATKGKFYCTMRPN